MSLTNINMSDRRAHGRYPFGTEARLVLPDGRNWIAHTLDIGVGGAAVVTDVNLPVGTALTVHMNLPARAKGSAAFQASASVANTILSPRDGGFRIGLQFSPLEPRFLAVMQGCLP